MVNKMSEEIFLFDIKESKYKPLDILGYRDPTIPKFPVLTEFEGNNFNIYEALHLIEITKVIKRKNNIEDFLEDQYLSYLKLVNLYKELLPQFNSELLAKYCKKQKGFTPDCIITPESKNGWLREGLPETFSERFNIPIHIAYKSSDIEFSTIDKIPHNFSFKLNVDISTIRNPLIVDDCKSKGNTTKCIKLNFNTDARFVEIFYLKSSP